MKHFSTMSEEEAQEMLAAAADPRYREMNSVPVDAGKTPEENLEIFMAWMKVVFNYVRHFEPSRELPRTHINLL